MPITTQTLGAFGFVTAMGIAKEATFGTSVAPSVYLPFTTSTFQGDNKLVARTGVRKTKGQTISAPGQFDVKGTFEVEAEPDSIGLLLGLALGTDTTAIATGVTTHTMKLASPLPSFTSTLDYGKNSTYAFTGNKVDGLDLMCKPDGPLLVRASCIGQNVVITPSASLSPTFGNNLPFTFEMISSFTLNGVQTPVDSFSISLKNSLKAYFGAASGRVLRNINETEANVSGSFTIPYESDVIQQVLLGGNTGPANTIAGVSLGITFLHTAMASGSTPYSLTITCPNIILESAPLDPKRNDIVSYNVRFKGHESTTGAQDDITIALANLAATAYTP